MHLVCRLQLFLQLECQRIAVALHHCTAWLLMFACRQLLQQQLRQQGVELGAVHIYSSPFSRTLETASIAAGAAGLDPAAVQVSLQR
jgi:hypothetical protein